MKWIDLKDVGIQGKGWPHDQTAHYYDRLPAHAEGVVTESVWRLSRMSTGTYVDFSSDTTDLHVRTILRLPPVEEKSYVKYLDLYIRDQNGKWRWSGTSKHGFIPSGQTPVVEGLSKQTRTFRLYLPLGYSVEKMELGVTDDAEMSPVSDDRKPVAVYGTSIVHSTASSRPGMTFTAILARKLDIPVLNLGFSGSARCEPPLGRILAELKPSMLVVDPIPNMMQPGLIAENVEPFLRNILAQHTSTPILMMEDRCHANEWLFPKQREKRLEARAAFRAVFETLTNEGFDNLHYFNQGDSLLGTDAEATIDASHPTDLGSMRMANTIEPVWRDILSL